MEIGAHLAWLDIEILNDEKGKPIASFTQKASDSFHNPQILLSISHTAEYALAVAIWL